MANTVYQRSIMDDEDEDTLDNNDQLVQVQEDNLTPEEVTWKKRYADLRRLEQKNALRLKDLERQIETGSKHNLGLPNANDNAALEEWMQTYPDIAKVVSTLATRQAAQLMEEVNSKVKDFEQDKRQNEIDRAIENLGRAHPDFFTEIRTDPEFIEWISGKSKRLQDALYSDESITDWQSAADVITLYKSEKGIGTKKTDTRREAVKEVPTRQTNKPSSSNEYTFTESQIKAMKPYEYDRLEDSINEAMSKGKVLMDLSGGAR